MGANKSLGKKVGLVDKYVGQKIKIERSKYGISQDKLGKILGVTFQQIQKYENGINRTPVSTLYKLSKVFSISLDYFFKDFNSFQKTQKLNNENLKEIKEEYELKNKYEDIENDVLKLNKLFLRIKTKQMRKMVLRIVKIFC